MGTREVGRWASRGDAGFLFGAQLGKEAIQSLLAAAFGQPEQFAGARVEHEGDEARFAQVLFIDEQRLQPIESRRWKFALEDVAVVAVGAGGRHRHHLAHALHRQPPAQEADLAHQPQRGHVLLDDPERAHRLVSCAVPAVALHRFVEHSHKARRPQRQIQRALPGLAVDPHRLAALPAARPAAFVPQKGDLCPFPVRVHAFDAVAFAFIESSELVSHPLQRSREGCRIHPFSLRR